MMRKALGRCSSASFHRALSTLTSNPHTVTRSIPSNAIRSTSIRQNTGGVRLIHSTLLRRQQQQQAEAGQEAVDGESPITKFQQLEDRGVVHSNIVNTITRDMGLETLTEVQSATITAALAGTDIIAQAKTGTGKTLAFLLPIFQRVLEQDPQLATRTGSRPRGPDIRAIVISPTRELAEQIAVEAQKLTRNTGIIVRTAVGGTQKMSGLRAIQSGCHLLVATPGRLKDILTDQYSRVEAPRLDAFVLDEADRLLDQGFWPDIQEIMRLLPTTAERDRQTLMFSATVPKEVIHVVRSTLKRGFQFVKCVRDDEEPTHKNVKQRLVVADGFENTMPTLAELCSRAINEGRQPGARPFKAIVYFNSTAEVNLAHSTFRGLTETSGAKTDAFGERDGRHPWWPTRVYEIHSRLTQAQRTAASDNFRNCESGILLSSDVTARGLDFPNVTHVIQMGVASSREQYIHRIGRTARAGKEGEGWLIVDEVERNETRERLYDLPLRTDDSLALARADLSQPDSLTAEQKKLFEMYQTAVKRAPMAEKSAVYKALLGVFTWFRRKEVLVDRMNRLITYAWGMQQPPAIPTRLAQKLKLDRLPGIRVADEYEQDESRDRFGGRDGFRSQRNTFGGRSQDRFGSRDPFERPDRSRFDRDGGRGSGRFGNDRRLRDPFE